NPLDIVEEYGADALRFTLISMAAPGRDIKLATSRVEGYRNFTTKLWNAARFCEMNECVVSHNYDPTSAVQTVNKWIIGEVAKAKLEIDRSLAAYRFNDAASAVYQFVWGTFCDWYLELAKPLFGSDDDAAKEETRLVAGWTLAQILKLMHPFTPFVTEEIWEKLGDNPEQLLITSDWPEYGEELVDVDAFNEMEWVIGLISGIRSVRSEMNVPPSAKVPMILNEGTEEAKAWLKGHMLLISRLARVSEASTDVEPPKGALEFVHSGATIALPIADVIDLEQEKARLEKAIKKAEGELKKISGKLSNEKFLANAPDAVVEENKARLAAEQDACDKLKASLDKILAAM
ncbi:MAG: class I tRNA ligase family protein, partial [Alphaproteobacteria bacterium]|nr:class I tRNA ligase family protein [Alphaproteobacteria bacterium]